MTFLKWQNYFTQVDFQNYSSRLIFFCFLGIQEPRMSSKSLKDKNYFECAHWLQAAMDVENIWPDGIPSIRAAQSLDHIQDWAQSCFYSSHEKNQGQVP